MYGVNVFPTLKYTYLSYCSWAHKINLALPTLAYKFIENLLLGKKKMLRKSSLQVDFRFIFCIYSADILLNISAEHYTNSIIASHIKHVWNKKKKFWKTNKNDSDSNVSSGITQIWNAVQCFLRRCRFKNIILS